MKRVTLELGGKSPNIVFADADLDAATTAPSPASSTTRARSARPARACSWSGAVHDEVVEKLAERAEAMTLGDPRDKATRMGPVISKQQMESVLGYVETGRSEGARVVAGGRRAEVGDGKGFFVQPTVFGGVTNEMTMAREEIFGPVLAVIPFDDVDDAWPRPTTIYGLAAGVWTRDVAKAHKRARAIRAGTVWINTYNLYDPGLPFGGFKERLRPRAGRGRPRGLPRDQERVAGPELRGQALTSIHLSSCLPQMYRSQSLTPS